MKDDWELQVVLESRKPALSGDLQREGRRSLGLPYKDPSISTVLTTPPTAVAEKRRL